MIRSARLAMFARRAVFIAVMALGVGSASAAVTAPHVIATLANSSGLELSEYTPGEHLTVDVVRGGHVVGTVSGAVAADGTFNVNPTECWIGVTPVILAGDVIRVTSDLSPFVDESPVKNVTIDSIVEVAGGLEVHGTAQDAGGNPLPISEVESRIISTTGEPFHENGRKRIQTGHVGAPGEGSMAYDAPGSTSWTATYGLDAHDLALAQSPSTELRGQWASLAADEVTIMILGAVPAPAAPCTAPVQQNAVIKATPHAISLATTGADVVIEGVSSDATSVQLKIDDTDGATPPVIVDAIVPAPATGSQTWVATIPATAIAGLSDGPLKASGTYFPGGIPGQDLIIRKDLVAPAPPTAAPGPGTYADTQAVLLQHFDAGTGTRIVYTTDGSDPTATSTRATGQIFVTNSLTLKAMVIDAVGNTSPVATFTYAIVRPSAGAGGGGTGATGGTGLNSIGSGSPASVSTVSTATVISKLTSTCIPMGHSATKVRGKCRPAIRFRLSRAARITVVVRTARGAMIGSFTRAGVRGLNTWIMPAKIGGRTLKPGRYTVALSPAGAAPATGKTRALVTVPAR